MPFNPKAKLSETQMRPFPVLEASHKQRLEEELRAIHQQMNAIVRAISEISTFLKSTT